MQKLNLPEGDITYYDADTDKELEQYKRLIENEELAHRVTISTKVLDVGVNIKTENVNVVVFDDDPIEIKQMVGRKRVKPDEDEKVLVYFHVPTIKELNKRKITKEDLNDLAERLLKILPDPRTDKRSDRNIGIVSINKAIKPYGYVVESKKKTVPVSYMITLTDEGKEQEANV